MLFWPLDRPVSLVIENWGKKMEQIICLRGLSGENLFYLKIKLGSTVIVLKMRDKKQIKTSGKVFCWQMRGRLDLSLIKLKKEKHLSWNSSFLLSSTEHRHQREHIMGANHRIVVKLFYLYLKWGKKVSSDQSLILSDMFSFFKLDCPYMKSKRFFLSKHLCLCLPETLPVWLIKLIQIDLTQLLKPVKKKNK